MPALILFPDHPTCSSENASRLHIFKSRLRQYAGKILGRARLPGFIAPTTINDSYSRQKIEVSVGIICTRISINGRDYYFSRLSGKFEGTGSGCS
jgi:hypothetical protein